MKSAILTDLTKCIGCEACTIACKESNGLAPGDATQLDAENFTRLRVVGNVNIRQQCFHCEEPACASACPVGALEKTAEGAVVYHQDRCMGCRYCMVACPFDIPKYTWDTPFPYVRKCTMCWSERVAKGEEPACTSTCPTGATVFGDREELIKEAYARIENEPDRYTDHVFGVREVGGTSVLYLSPVPFEQLGFKTTVRDESYPELTWNVLSKLPNVVSVAGAGALGLWWIIKRRDTLARLRHEAAEAGESAHQDTNNDSPKGPTKAS